MKNHADALATAQAFPWKSWEGGCRIFDLHKGNPHEPRIRFEDHINQLVGLRKSDDERAVCEEERNIRMEERQQKFGRFSHKHGYYSHEWTTTSVP